MESLMQEMPCLDRQAGETDSQIQKNEHCGIIMIILNVIFSLLPLCGACVGIIEIILLMCDVERQCV